MADEHHASRYDHPRVTQKDVAERAGVAVSVVSYVVNNVSRPVSADARARVLKAIDELGYRPNEYARRLIQQNWGGEMRPRQFGIIVSDSHSMIGRPFYTALIVGLLDEAIRQNYSLRFIHLYDALHNPILFNELIHPETIAGVIVMHHQIVVDRDRELLEKIIERLSNVVCLDFRSPNLPSILFDQRDAGRCATDHLVQLGHRRIGFIGNRDYRLDGYMDSLRHYGIPMQDEYIVGDGRANRPEDGWEAANTVLSLPTPPTAVFCASDEVAVGALCAATERGLRVPDDLSIIGVDDIDLARFSSPPLTTIAVPKADMAALAMRTLVDHESRASAMPINMVFPVKLIQRRSTAAPKSD
jgi:DNA-binding LacI/PurR family transcriptional regulator